MRNFHLTRIAVIPLLIVAVAIQPMAVCLANVGGKSACSQPGTFTCQGCGCCEVERLNERCSCCSGPTEADADKEVDANCCGEKQDTSDQSKDSSEQESSISQIDIGLQSICLCEQNSQPLSDSSPRRPTCENRDIVSLESNALNGSAWNAGHLTGTSQFASPLPPAFHFAQIMLCIWRL